MYIQTLLQTGSLTERDIDQIYEIAGRRTSHVTTPDRRDLEIVFGRGTVLIIAREKSERTTDIHGLATLSPLATILHVEMLVTSIIVPKHYRGRHIGIRLVEGVLKYCEGQRVHRVRLLHPSDDADADRVFRQHGFVPESTETLYVLQR